MRLNVAWVARHDATRHDITKCRVRERKVADPSNETKVEREGVISRSDIKVLKEAIGISGAPVSSKSIVPKSVATPQRRSVLDGMKYGPGSRPVWADPGTPWFPNVTKTFLEAARGPLREYACPLGTIVGT